MAVDDTLYHFRDVFTLQDAAAATGDGTPLKCRGHAVVTVQVTGTFTATVTFEATLDGTNWVAVEAVNINDGSKSTTASAPGIFLAPIAGATSFRARVTWTSGTSVTVKGRALPNVGVSLADVSASSTVTQVTPGTGATDLGKAEDAAHTSGDVGVEMLAVRQNSATALAANGDYIPLIVDANGRLHVIADVSRAEDAAHTSGDTGVMPLAVRKDAATALADSDGDYAPLEVDASGRLHVAAPPVTTGTLANGAQTAVSSSAVEVLAANSNRKRAIVQNVGANAVRIGIAAVTATTGIQLAPGATLQLEVPYIHTGAIFAIRESADSTVFATEVA